MVAGGDQQHGRGVGADAMQGEQSRGAGRHQGNDELIEALELAVQEPGAPAQLPQRDPGGITDRGAAAGRWRRSGR